MKILDPTKPRLSSFLASVIKCHAPNRGHAPLELSRCAAGRSKICVLLHVPPDQGSLDANPLSRKVVLVTKEAASAVCGWLVPERHDNQMKAQHGKEPESVKRHHTGKRMILILRFKQPSITNQSGFGPGARKMMPPSRGMGNPGSPGSAYLGQNVERTDNFFRNVTRGSSCRRKTSPSSKI